MSLMKIQIASIYSTKMGHLSDHLAKKDTTEENFTNLQQCVQILMDLFTFVTQKTIDYKYFSMYDLCVFL